MDTPYRGLPYDVVFAINLVRVLHFHKLDMPLAAIARDCNITRNMAQEWIDHYSQHAEIMDAELMVTWLAFQEYDKQLASGGEL